MTRAPAEIHETHVSWVVLLGDRAYKVKKPVDNGFVDWRSLDARCLACVCEVELNRRLAPDVYLGVADLVGPGGDVWEHVVVMRRMPAERRLSALVSSSEARARVREVARGVAAFHTRAERSGAADAAATSGAVRALWEANHAQMGRFLGPVLSATRAERLLALAQRFLAGRATLLDERIRAGMAVDGQGDLLAGDIYCLDDGPRILDCLEFDDSLRRGDALLDVAFLAMDLERLGHPELATALLADHAEFTGAVPESALARHYIAYRAQVRSKVACLRWEQGEADAAREARELLSLALEHAEAARVRLVLVGGAPGTGKTTLATALAARPGWSVLSSDEVRRDLFGERDARGSADFGEGVYSADAKERTYAELIRRAASLVRRGRSVVLDATWADPRWRARAAGVAALCDTDVVALVCEAPAPVAEARILARIGAGDTRSDATPATARRLRSAAAPWPEALVIRTGGELNAALAAALEVVDAGGGGEDDERHAAPVTFLPGAATRRAAPSSR